MRSKEGKGGGAVSEERKSRLGGEWLFLLVFVAGGCLWGERFDRLREKKKIKKDGRRLVVFEKNKLVSSGWKFKNFQTGGGGSFG